DLVLVLRTAIAPPVWRGGEFTLGSIMLSLPCLSKRRSHTSQQVQLMRDVHERALLYLRMALRYPGRKALSVQVWMPCQSGVHGVDNEVEEIGLICSIAVGTSEDYPVGAAGSEHFRTGSPEMGKEMASGATVPRWFASYQASIHGLVIARLNGHIELQ